MSQDLQVYTIALELERAVLMIEQIDHMTDARLDHAVIERAP